MKPGALTRLVLGNMREWQRDTQKLVVALDGYSGAGKTSLATDLTRHSDQIVVLHQDDFVLPARERKDALSNASDPLSVFELNFHDDERIRNLVSDFRAGKYKPDRQALLVDGVFLFHPRGLNELWDKRIYLDAEEQVADQRRQKREKKRWGYQYVEETRKDSYFRLLTLALKRYRKEYQPERMADLVVTGSIDNQP